MRTFRKKKYKNYRFKGKGNVEETRTRGAETLGGGDGREVSSFSLGVFVSSRFKQETENPGFAAEGRETKSLTTSVSQAHFFSSSRGEEWA